MKDAERPRSIEKKRSVALQPHQATAIADLATSLRHANQFDLRKVSVPNLLRLVYEFGRPTQWEKYFLVSACGQVKTRGYMTIKQREVLRRIVEKRVLDHVSIVDVKKYLTAKQLTAQAKASRAER